MGVILFSIVFILGTSMQNNRRMENLFNGFNNKKIRLQIFERKFDFKNFQKAKSN
jgi:hypothetical protein